MKKIIFVISIFVFGTAMYLHAKVTPPPEASCPVEAPIVMGIVLKYLMPIMSVSQYAWIQGIQQLYSIVVNKTNLTTKYLMRLILSAFFYFQYGNIYFFSYIIYFFL
ncbi:MAG: hypothetical protein IPM10_04760 [Chitinophagaceae bacterium]|nr:hypothetical protein [Chitinophagaceae bacterium]